MTENPNVISILERAEKLKASTPIPSTAELLADVLSALERYVVFSLDSQAVAIALWILNTYVFALYDSTPYLHIRSATKQSGKSRLLEVLGLLVARPWTAIEATEAVLFRKIEASTPTLLLDEIDAAFAKDATMTEGLRAVLNAGYRRGATVPRCVGPQHELRDFAVFCPKAFAGIGATLPDTVMDRSIPIELRRRAPGERQPARFRQARARAELTPLQDRISTWSKSACDKLTNDEPDLPDELSDRQQDSWEPLLSIADLAGGEWPDRARNAAIALHADVADQDVGMLLLAHLRQLFEESDTDALSTDMVLAALVNRGDDSPWARWWGADVEHGQTKGPGSQLARKLKPYGIKPEQLWLDGKKIRGYRRSDFDDAWGRYLPSKLSTTVQPPEKDGRTVDRRSEGISGQYQFEAKSASEQDSTVLPCLTGVRDGRAVSEPDSDEPVDEAMWLYLGERIEALPPDSAPMVELQRLGWLPRNDLTRAEVAEVHRMIDEWEATQ